MKRWRSNSKALMNIIQNMFLSTEKVVAEVRTNECQSNLKANARSISHQQSNEKRRNAFISEKQECNPQIGILT